MGMAMQGSGISGMDVGSATLKVNDEGFYTLLIGAADMGTGCDTTLAQIAAEVMECDLDDITVFGADTDTSPYDSGSYASSTTYITGKAVEKCALKLRSQICKLGAQLLDCSENDVEFDGTEPLDASAAAERACKEVQQETPLGAYAVKYLTYTIDDSARNYTAIHLTIGYRRTQEQIASMVYTTSVSALGGLLTAAARRGSGELVVQVGYFDHQEEEVRSIVDQVQAMEAPEQKEPWTVNFYPEGGDVGIIEILLKKS